MICELNTHKFKYTIKKYLPLQYRNSFFFLWCQASSDLSIATGPFRKTDHVGRVYVCALALV